MTSIRDLTCIHSVAHMTEYGKYEEEFIVYGCCSKENGKLLYRISPDYKELATFAQNAIFTEQYPSPIHTAMNRCVVQAGQKETLLYETELRLAASLQCMYPQLFFDEIDKCVVVKSSDAARSIFLQLQTQMNGIFSLDYLQLFEGLLQMAYQAKLLTKPTLTTIQAWVQKMQKQMACDVVIMKPLERTFYGFCYQNSNGAYCYKMNAQEYAVLQEQRKIKRRGLACTPIFHKTYRYDYQIEPKMLREQFRQQLESYLGAQYWQYWKAIRALPSVVSTEQFVSSMEKMERFCGQEAKEAFKEYAYDWNLAL